MGFKQKKQTRKKRPRGRKSQRTGFQVQATSPLPALTEDLSTLPDDPVFERFVAQQEQTHDKAVALAVKQTGHEDAIIRGLSVIHHAAWHRCEHIFLSPGVVEMLDEISHDPESYGLPERPSCRLLAPAWIKIEEEQFPPFYEYLDLNVRGIFLLEVFSPGNLALIKKQAFARSLSPTIDRAFALLRDYVTVQLIGAEGECLFKLEFQQKAQRWTLAAEHRCPYHTCRVVAGRCQQPCARCEMALDLFSRWCPICVLALQGRFRQIEQERSPKAATKLGKGSGKTTPPVFRVVRTIDVSVRPVRQTSGEVEESPAVSPRGSWVEKARAVDPYLVKKEVRDVPERTRILKHERYRNYIERTGTNEVTVRAHQRSVSLLNVPRTTHARAKRYDNKEEK